MRGFLIVLICLPFIASAAVKITGIAPNYAGEPVRLLKFEDHISQTTIELAKTRVGEDSIFTLEYELDKTMEAMVAVGNVYGFIYLQPDGNYKIAVPKAEYGTRLSNNFVELIFVDLPPKDDINLQIMGFDYLEEQFYSKTFDLMGSELWGVYLDTFKRFIQKEYENTDNDFFLQYVTFAVANLELIGNPKEDVGINQEYVYRTFIHDYPVLYEHPVYMRLYNNFYKNIFENVAALHEREIVRGVILESKDSLDKVMMNYPYYLKPGIREMSIIKGLGESYLKNEMPRANLLNLLEDYSENAQYPHHKVIAKNLIGKLTKLKKGYPARNFTLTNIYGEEKSLDGYKGKYVYLTFFEPWSSQSVSEFSIMKKLKERYGKHITMVSVCMGPDSTSLETFLKQHQDYDWDFLNAYGHPELKKQYEITTYPLYYLIDKGGNIIQAPALSPSPRGNYESIDKTMFHIHKNNEIPDQRRPPGARGGP